MRIVVADCTVNYAGRLAAHLPRATRLIIIKADGSLLVHAESGAYKPLNWMNAPNHLVEEDGRWFLTNGKGEQLTIDLHEIHMDTTVELGEDPGLVKDGVEFELQRLLAEQPEAIEEGMTLVRREYPTPIGPVDLMCRDAAGGTVAIEVKRRGEIDGVEQLTRYLEFLNRDERLAPVRGIFVAQTVKPQARTLATDRGMTWKEVDYEFLKGSDSDVLRLF
ncbi:MAG: endonuclease NucS [Actinomycetota bacterium]|nr:endonuclease NucS [Actinomycetota bacterium]